MFGQTKQRLANIEDKLENQYEVIKEIYHILTADKIEERPTEDPMVRQTIVVQKNRIEQLTGKVNRYNEIIDEKAKKEKYH